MIMGVLSFVVLILMGIAVYATQRVNTDGRSEAAGLRCAASPGNNIDAVCDGKAQQEIVENGTKICAYAAPLNEDHVKCKAIPYVPKKSCAGLAAGTDPACVGHLVGDLVNNSQSVCVETKKVGLDITCKAVAATGTGCGSNSAAECKGKPTGTSLGFGKVCSVGANVSQNPDGTVICGVACDKNLFKAGDKCLPVCEDGLECAETTSQLIDAHACALKKSKYEYAAAQCCTSNKKMNSTKTACYTPSTSSGSGSGSTGSGGSSGGSGSGGNGGNGGSNPGPVPTPTADPAIRGNYCVWTTVGSSNVSPGQSTTMSSVSNTLVNNFWYVAYNADNVYSANNPKPVCVTTGGDVPGIQGPCPAGSYQLIFLNSNKTLRQNSGAISRTYSQLFPADMNWTSNPGNKQVINLQLNGYFSVEGGQFSLPMPNCVKTIHNNAAL